MPQHNENDQSLRGQPLLTQALREVLVQALQLVGTLDRATYAALPEGMASSGAGAHLRHTMDFSRRLLEGIHTGRIDYDRRARNPKEEVDPECAAQALKGLIADVDALVEFDPTLSVEVRHDLPAELLRAADPKGSEWTASSLGRELLFVVSHTIHHYAIMAMCLRFQGVEVDPGFGVAPSTLRYWDEEGDPRAVQQELKAAGRA